MIKYPYMKYQSTFDNQKYCIYALLQKLLKNLYINNIKCSFYDYMFYIYRALNIVIADEIREKITNTMKFKLY